MPEQGSPGPFQLSPERQKAFVEAVYLFLRNHAPHLDLTRVAELQTEEEILAFVGADPGEAYAVLNRLREHLPALFAGPTPGERRRAVQDVYIRFLITHPGAVRAEEGRGYVFFSDEVRCFLVDLVGPGGLAEGMSVDDLAAATDIPVDTLADLLRPMNS